MSLPAVGKLNHETTGAMRVNDPFFFIVNPKAGGGRTERLWPIIQDRLKNAGVTFDWEQTTKPYDATRLVRQVPAADRTVVAVGGDGTVNECVAGLSGDTPLGIIPTGHSNDFARSVGISNSPLEAVNQLIEAQIRPIDLPEVNGLPFLSTIGIGYGVDMARSTQRFAKRISVIDLLRLFRALPRVQVPELSIEIDGQVRRGKVFLMAIGNGRYFSGGLDICPQAHCDDGLLDVCIAGDLKRAEVILALTRLFRGTHLRQRKFHYTKAHSIRINGPEDIPIHVDGQPMGNLPATIRIRHRALSLLVPKGTWKSSKVTTIWRRRDPDLKEEIHS